MAKDLPYFKFFCSEWNDGDITLETYEHQGLFINICSYYWSNECNLHFDKLLKRFRGKDELIDDLSAAGLFKLDDNRNLLISFLDEQREERLEQSKIKSKGGKASAEARRLKKLQQKTNTILTENQHVLKSCSTESQLLRREEIREDNIKGDFSALCLKDAQWLENVCRINKTKPEVIKINLKKFESHLITLGEIKPTLKDFKFHFTNWLRKQDLKPPKKRLEL